jgi:pro-sigmaK processing inhibitor BofA
MNYLVTGIVLLFVVALLWSLIKKIITSASKLIINSVAGVLILLFLNAYAGWGIEVNPATVLICGIFGVPGIGTLIILYLAGML